MESSYNIKVVCGPDVDIIQYCCDYVHILDTLNDKYDLITQDHREFLKAEQQRLTKYSNPFLVFMRKCAGFKEVIDQFKHLLANTEQMPETKRSAQFRERLFDKTSNEPTDAKIILDGFIGFYSSPRGNLLKEKDFFDGHALCYGALTLIPGNKAACDYIVRPEKVDTVLGGSSWHGQPHLRNDRSRIGLCPACLESLLKMRIESHHTFLVKIRNSLASNKNSPHAKAATEKEKQLTLELRALQNDLEKTMVAKSALEKFEAETQPNEGQTSQMGGVDEEDMELMSILQQESTQDITGSSEDKHEGNDAPFDEGESSNSERNESIESARLTRAAKKKATTKRNELEKDKSTQRKSVAPKIPKLLPSQHKTKLDNTTTEPSKVQLTRTRSSSRKTDQTNNNVLSIEQLQSLKRKHQGGDAFSPNKKQKRQSADNQNVSNISTTEEQNELTLRVEDSTFSYPITKSQVFLFNALAVVVSPEFSKSAEMRAMYHDSMSQVDLATLSHLKDMLSLAHTKKCESMGLK